MKQVSLKSEHFVEVNCLEKTFSPYWGKGVDHGGENYIMVFMSHHYLPYETSFTQIGALLWKFTAWGKGG